MKTFYEWLELNEISSNLLGRAADAAALRGDPKGERLQAKFLKGADEAGRAAIGAPRASSWHSGGVEPGHRNAGLIPDYSSIKYINRNKKEGFFTIKNIESNDWTEWFLGQRKERMQRLQNNPEATGRISDRRTVYTITTTNPNEKVTIEGMDSTATLWQSNEEPIHKKLDMGLQVKLNGEDIFLDKRSAVELARQLSKFVWETGLKNGFVKPGDKPYVIDPSRIKQA